MKTKKIEHIILFKQNCFFQKITNNNTTEYTLNNYTQNPKQLQCDFISLLSNNKFDFENNLCKINTTGNTYSFNILKKENAQTALKTTFYENIQSVTNSKEINYGLYDVEIYMDLFCNIDCNNANIKFIDWASEKFKTKREYSINDKQWKVVDTYFRRLDGATQEEKVKTFLQDLDLFDIETQKVKKLNNKDFAIVPFCCDGHISTLLIDLREEISLDKRIYSFDTSNYHYYSGRFCRMVAREDIFGELSKCINVLSDKDLQLTGCCGYWAKEFIKVISNKDSIENIIDYTGKIKNDILIETADNVINIFNKQKNELTEERKKEMQCVNYKNVYGDEEQVECQYMKDYYENLKQKYNAIDKDMNEHINSIQKTLNITNLSTEQVLKINKYFNKLYHNYYKLNMLYIQDNEQNFSKENKMQNYKESLTNILDKIRTLNSMDQYKNTAIQNIILPKKN